MLYAERAQSLVKKTSDFEDFEELMVLAEETGRLPIAKSSSKYHEGPKTYGPQITKAWQRNANLALFEAVKPWFTKTAKSIKKPSKFWQAIAEVSLYQPDLDKGELRGYNTVQLQLNAKAGDFAISSIIASARTSSPQKAIIDLLARLNDAFLAGIVFVHSTSLHNWNNRTDDERRKFESLRRKKRKKK